MNARAAVGEGGPKGLKLRVEAPSHPTSWCGCPARHLARTGSLPSSGCPTPCSWATRSTSSHRAPGVGVVAKPAWASWSSKRSRGQPAPHHAPRLVPMPWPRPCPTGSRSPTAPTARAARWGAWSSRPTPASPCGCPSLACSRHRLRLPPPSPRCTPRPGSPGRGVVVWGPPAAPSKPARPCPCQRPSRQRGGLGEPSRRAEERAEYHRTVAPGSTGFPRPVQPVGIVRFPTDENVRLSPQREGRPCTREGPRWGLRRGPAAGACGGARQRPPCHRPAGAQQLAHRVAQGQLQPVGLVVDRVGAGPPTGIPGDGGLDHRPLGSGQPAAARTSRWTAGRHQAAIPGSPCGCGRAPRQGWAAVLTQHADGDGRVPPRAHMKQDRLAFGSGKGEALGRRGPDGPIVGCTPSARWRATAACQPAASATGGPAQPAGRGRWTSTGAAGPRPAGLHVRPPRSPPLPRAPGRSPGHPAAPTIQARIPLEVPGQQPRPPCRGHRHQCGAPTWERRPVSWSQRRRTGRTSPPSCSQLPCCPPPARSPAPWPPAHPPRRPCVGPDGSSSRPGGPPAAVWGAETCASGVPAVAAPPPPRPAPARPAAHRPPRGPRPAAACGAPGKKRLAASPASPSLRSTSGTIWYSETCGRRSAGHQHAVGLQLPQDPPTVPRRDARSLGEVLHRRAPVRPGWGASARWWHSPAKERQQHRPLSRLQDRPRDPAVALRHRIGRRGHRNRAAVLGALGAGRAGRGQFNGRTPPIPPRPPAIRAWPRCRSAPDLLAVTAQGGRHVLQGLASHMGAHRQPPGPGKLVHQRRQLLQRRQAILAVGDIGRRPSQATRAEAASWAAGGGAGRRGDPGSPAASPSHRAAGAGPRSGCVWGGRRQCRVISTRIRL